MFLIALEAYALQAEAVPSAKERRFILTGALSHEAEHYEYVASTENVPIDLYR